MVLAALLALTALAAVIVALHLEQRTLSAEHRPEWVERVEDAQTVTELLQTPLPRVMRGVDPVAVRVVIARAGQLRPEKPIENAEDHGAREAVGAHDAAPDRRGGGSAGGDPAAPAGERVDE